MQTAVLVDVENTCFKKMKLIMNKISDAYPNLRLKRAYGDFSKSELRPWKTECLENSLIGVQQFSYASKKGSSDMRMCIDAMDMLHANPDIDVFCIVTSDSDFTPLVMRLREGGKLVYGIGKQQTPDAFVKACNTFNFIENMEERAAHQISDDARLNHIIELINEHAVHTNGIMNLGLLKEKMVDLGYDRRLKMKPTISEYADKIELTECNNNIYVRVRPT